MNFVCTTRHSISGPRLKAVQKVVSVVLLVALVGLAGMGLSRFVCFFGASMVREGFFQNLIASLPRKVEVDGPFFGYTAVQRFRQAGVEMSRGADEPDAAVWDRCPVANMPRRDPVTQRVALPSKDELRPRTSKPLTLPCTDVRTGEKFALNSGMSLIRFGTAVPWKVWIKDLIFKGKLRTVIDYFPHVLWDDGQGGAK